MAALKIAYNKKVVHSGPICQSATIDKIKMIRHVTNAGVAPVQMMAKLQHNLLSPALIKSLFAPKQS